MPTSGCRPIPPPPYTRRTAGSCEIAGGRPPRPKRHKSPDGGHTNAGGGRTHLWLSTLPPPPINPEIRRGLSDSRRPLATSQAPMTSPPPVSTTPAAGVLPGCSPPIPPPQAVLRAAAGFYRACGSPSRPKGHTQRSLRSHRHRRWGYFPLVLHQSFPCLQTGELPPTCTKSGAARRFPDTTQPCRRSHQRRRRVYPHLVVHPSPHPN